MNRPTACQLLSDERWAELIDAADRLAAPCRLCPHRCGVDRHQDQRGFCRAPGELHISSIFAHHGEEPPLSGTGGSGTVFFSYCTLRCVYCQNFQLSHHGEGRVYTPDELAGYMLELQRQGCHNINFVTATHYFPWLLRALREASCRGLTIPVVYNCGGYESPETLELLREVVDIYLPDMKYADDRVAKRCSNASDYVSVNRTTIRLMYRAGGPLRTDEQGLAYRGLCIRHLVLPNGMSGSEQTAAFLTSTFDPADITISLMAQYRPLHQAAQYGELARRITAAEFRSARHAFEGAGFPGFYQDAEGLDESFVIDFTRRKFERLCGE